ncbi:MAG: vitamin B12 dependent-methionine synthase activation domain-containing protein [Clostridia bacterium]
MLVRKSEVLRYLGCTEADARLSQEVDEAIAGIAAAAQPKSRYMRLPLEISGEEVTAGRMHAISKNLAKNLVGCREIILFAATLGAGADAEIRKFSHIAMSRAVILQAAASAYIEEFCDECEENIRAEMAKEGLSLRPRFSPGYGDFPLACQREIVEMLDCPRKIGLTLTEHLMLAPSKSVTAVIGLSSEKTACVKHGCESCSKTDCEYRRR